MSIEGEELLLGYVFADQKEAARNAVDDFWGEHWSFDMTYGLWPDWPEVPAGALALRYYLLHEAEVAYYSMLEEQRAAVRPLSVA